MKRRAHSASSLDLSHLGAVPLKVVIPGPHNALRLYLIGTGGTGSWLAPHVVRLARFLRETKGMTVFVTMIDPDVVEPKNVFRQNFSTAEIGSRKAETLALRLGAAWGIEIQVHTERFDKGMIEWQHGDIGLLIGCVDNAAARKSIADALNQSGQWWNSGAYSDQSPPLPQVWWLDTGNGENTGQVVLGSTNSLKILRHAFPHYPDCTYCVHLPAPHLQHPDLLEQRPHSSTVQAETLAASCADLLWSGDQSPSINSMVASIASAYLWRIFADKKGLTTFATYCDLRTFSLRSQFITPDAVAQVAGAKSASQMFTGKTGRKKEAVAG